MDKIFPLSLCMLALIHEAPASSILALSMCSCRFYVFAMLRQEIQFLLTSQLVTTKETFNKRNQGNIFCVWSRVIDKPIA